MTRVARMSRSAFIPEIPGAELFHALPFWAACGARSRFLKLRYPVPSSLQSGGEGSRQNIVGDVIASHSAGTVARPL